MDPLSALFALVTSQFPGAASWIALLVAAAAAAAMFLPAPSATAKPWYRAVYAVVNALGMNKLHAANAAAKVLPLLLIAAVTLAACNTQTGTLTPQAQQSLANLCAQDAKYQPVAVLAADGAATLAPMAGPTGATVGAATAAGVAVDQTTLHPMVQDACAKLPPGAAAAPAK
jgi:hypothetical protein